MAIAGYLCRWIIWGCLPRRAPSRSSPKDVEGDQGAPQDEQQSPQDHDRARLRPDEAGDERGVESQGYRRPLAQNPRAPDGYTKEDESRSVREEGQDEYHSQRVVEYGVDYDQGFRLAVFWRLHGGGPLVTWPDVDQVAIRFLEPGHPRLGILLAGPGLFSIQRDEAFLDVRRHPAGIPAHVDRCAILDGGPDIVPLRLYAVLHVRLRLSIEPRERALEIGDSLPGERFELLLVDVVLIGIAAAEEQRGWSDLFPRDMTTARSWRNQRKGASPVPAATMISGVDGSCGSTKGVLGDTRNPPPRCQRPAPRGRMSRPRGTRPDQSAQDLPPPRR
jgi:hypothetical protein